MKLTRPRVKAQLIPFTTPSAQMIPQTAVSTTVIRNIEEHEVPSNFITVCGGFIKTADGDMFFVKNSNS